MYEVFNHFITTDTWYTRHANDEQRFNIALQKVAGKEAFNPDAMRDYMAQKIDVKPDNEHFNYALDEYRAAAWAVKSYLKAVA